MRFVQFRGSDGALYVLLHEPDARRLDPAAHERVGFEAARVVETASVLAQRDVAKLWLELRRSEAADAGVTIGDEIGQVVAELGSVTSDLALLRIVRPRPALSYEPITEDTPLLSDLAEPIQSDSWAGFTLLDLAGEPLPDVRYELTLPDGKTESGTTDASGQARHASVARGSCSISFPDLDETYWESASAGG